MTTLTMLGARFSSWLLLCTIAIILLFGGYPSSTTAFVVSQPPLSPARSLSRRRPSLNLKTPPSLLHRSILEEDGALHAAPGRRNNNNDDDDDDSTARRRFIQSSSLLSFVFSMPFPSHAVVFERVTKDLSYSMEIPTDDMKQTKKPLPTHLDEINFVSSETADFQFGITVDPVRIQSLKEFGTPEEVAARVVTAEVNRDGVFEVTLLRDPILVEADGSYVLEYLSKGKRGNKHFVCKIYIERQKLYVLTAQIKEDNFSKYEAQIRKGVESFRVLERP